MFCLACGKREDKVCPRCLDKVTRVEQTGLGTVFMCTHGGTRYNSEGCRRTYLSQRDLQVQSHTVHSRRFTSYSLIYFVYPWIHSKLIWVSCKQHCWQIKLKNLSTQISNFKSGSYNYLHVQNFGSDLWNQNYHSFPLLTFGFRIYCQSINKILPLYTYL